MTKRPVSARVLNTWITQAQDRLGTAGPRLGWLVGELPTQLSSSEFKRLRAAVKAGSTAMASRSANSFFG